MSGNVDEVGLGMRLQQARKNAGLTQQQLCGKADLSYSTLAKIERGAIKSPSIFTVRQVAIALNISVDDILGLEHGRVEQKPKKISKSGIEFVYFDINGCLVRFYHRAFSKVAEDLGVSSDRFECIFLRYDDAACRGDLSLEEFNSTLAKQMEVPYFDWSRYYMEAVEPIAETQELIEWVSKYYKCGLISNIMPGMIQEMQENGKLPKIDFDQVIESSVVHATKPEPTIFQVATERSGVPPESILFVDDTSANLVAAEKQGWKTIWFDGFSPDDSIKRINSALEFEE